jgi:hypothetical protein
MAMFETLSSLLATKVGAAVAAGALVATAGAAAATLPEQAADDAQQQVEDVDTQDLDTQDAESLEAERGPDEDADDTAHRVWDVISTWEGDRGCAFGQSVAAAARGEAAPDEFPCDQADERRAEAEDRAAEAQEDAAERRAEAQERAAEGQGNAPSDVGPPADAGTGLDTADDARP